MKHVAIVLVNYNSEKETRACLESLRKIKTLDFTFSIVVVDNGSKEPLNLSHEVLPKNTTVVRSDSNLGFTSGNNLGIEHEWKQETPDYVLLLNNDTTVAEDFLIQLIACAEKDEKAGVVTPKIYFSPDREFHSQSYTQDEHGKVLWYAGGSIDWRNLDAFHRGVDELDRQHFDAQTESDFATGCCMLIPRAVIERVGRFDKKYFLYLEDVDLSLRIRQAGFKLIFCPQSVIWHKNAGSSGGSGSALHQYYQTRNRFFFFFKYGKWKLRLFILRFALHLLSSGTAIEKRATIDWLFGRMGKQPVL
jgi:GT2 family glycosyltransferase